MGAEACLANFLQAIHSLIITINPALFMEMGNRYCRFAEMFDNKFQQ